MTIPIKTMTVSEFDHWVLLPENSDTSYEYIGEEIVEEVSNNYASLVALEIGFLIKLYLKQHKMRGYVTGADGGYVVAGERYIPDVAYISAERQSEPSHDAYNPNAPDLAVEVVSPTDSERNLAIKVANYLVAGTVIWVVYPDRREVNIFVPQQAVKQLGANDVLDGSGIFPEFNLKVSDIFPEE